MGAFENQIRENETFETLMDLYAKSLAENKRLREALTKQTNAIERLAASLEKDPANRTIAMWWRWRVTRARAVLAGEDGG